MHFLTISYIVRFFPYQENEPVPKWQKKCTAFFSLFLLEEEKRLYKGDFIIKKQLPRLMPLIPPSFLCNSLPFYATKKLTLFLIQRSQPIMINGRTFSQWLNP